MKIHCFYFQWMKCATRDIFNTICEVVYHDGAEVVDRVSCLLVPETLSCFQVILYDAVIALFFIFIIPIFIIPIWMNLDDNIQNSFSLSELALEMIWATSWQSQQNGMCAQQRLRSGWASSLIRVFVVRLKKARILSYPLSAQRRLWSDLADAQADLSFRWAHMPLCWFCHEAAHTAKRNILLKIC